MAAWEQVRVICLALATVSPLGCAGGDEFEARVFQDVRGERLPYRIFQPRPLRANEATTYPLIVFLHGGGRRGTDNAQQVQDARVWAGFRIQSEHPCFVLAPQCPPDFRWVEVDWSSTAHKLPEQPSRPMRLLMELVPALRKELPIDPRRIYLTGVSMGGYGTWDLLARHPDWFAAAVPICGGADPATSPGMAPVPVWVFHSADDPIVPVARARGIVKALRQAGGTPRYTEYARAGHFAWKVAYDDPALPSWLFSQRRAP